MLLTYEAEMDEQGVIRLGDLIRSPKRRRVYVTLLDDVSVSETEVINTLGDLLEHGFGFWSHHDEIDDSAVYAQQLRRKSWTRNTL